MTCNRCSQEMFCSASTETELGYTCRCGNYGIIRKEVNPETGNEELVVNWDGVQIRDDLKHPLLQKLWQAVHEHRSKKASQ